MVGFVWGELRVDTGVFGMGKKARRLALADMAVGQSGTGSGMKVSCRYDKSRHQGLRSENRIHEPMADMRD